MPVFLFVADIAAGDVYFMSVEPPIRQNYGKLSSQDTISFPLVEAFSLKNRMGPPVLEWMAKREHLHRDFVFHLSNLLSHAGDFHHFIEMNQGRDAFMEVEAEAHLRFRSLYQSCNMAASYLHIDWEIESLGELYRRDREQFQDRYVRLHEHTLSYALGKIEAIFPRIIREAIELIAGAESDYWRAHQPLLHEMCSSNELEWTVRRIEEDIARARA